MHTTILKKWKLGLVSLSALAIMAACGNDNDPLPDTELQIQQKLLLTLKMEPTNKQMKKQMKKVQPTHRIQPALKIQRHKQLQKAFSQ